MCDRAAAREVRFSRSIYRLETIKKAAYRLTDRCSFEFTVDEDHIHCYLFSRDQTSVRADDELEHALRNEVLDQDLRESIALETGPIRNAILAYAFSRTGLQDAEPI